MTRLKVLNSHELWEGEMCQVRTSRASVVVIRLSGGVVAYEDRCPHLGVPLSFGELDGNTLTCSAHHYTFDATTGCGINPCNVALKAVPVLEEGERIFIDVEPLEVGPSDRLFGAGARR